MVDIEPCSDVDPSGFVTRPDFKFNGNAAVVTTIVTLSLDVAAAASDNVRMDLLPVPPPVEPLTGSTSSSTSDGRFSVDLSKNANRFHLEEAMVIRSNKYCSFSVL